MKVDLTRKQCEGWELLNNDKRNVLLYGGARSGKSYVIACWLIHCSLTYPGLRTLIARLRFSHAKTSIWHETVIPIMKHIPRRMWTENRSDYYIDFANGSEMWLGGFDDKDRVEKLLGHEYNAIYFNEISQIGYEAVEMGKSRLAKRTEGFVNKSIYDCNPPSPLHWAHRLFIEKRDPRTLELLGNPETYAYLKMNPRDNLENLDEEYIEQELANLSDRARRRMLLGEWVKAEGTIFENFAESMVIPQAAAPRVEDWTIGVDFGLNMAAILVGWCGDNVYVFDDTGGYALTARKMNEVIRDKWGQKRYIAYCDPSGGERLQEIAYSAEANNSVDPGLDYINTLIDNKRFFVCENCHGVLGEIYDYRRDDKEKVIKENDHYMDAMRYAIFSRAQIPRFKMEFL